MSTQHCDILIIGAGMAGLACAKALSEAGRKVTVLDKGRGPGGRMAARRAEIAGNVVSFDHGAQYFTARDARFVEVVKEWERLGVVARWDGAGSSDPAFVGVPGMNGPIRALAHPLDVRWSTRAETLTRLGEEWHVDAGDESFTADTVLVAVPAEQAADILAVTVPDFAKVAASVQSEPCWAVMAAFSQKLDVTADSIRDESASISWAARNSAKPDRAGRETWVLHASPKRSRELVDLPKEEVGPILLDDFFDQTGTPCVAPIHLAAHRWLYAMPKPVDGEAARYDRDRSIGIAGDYLHSPRVEGAWISGRGLADQVLAE
ncbi:hypothetical protein NAP1_07685 [Erythrobacter sp. NAP1]|uniref:NAD(P)/FAD-dependent oxidoreductase n=1 Tax=Erythrobacter sp. NAP1 TaxID=237727 RepID=UPI0000686E71|nr:FAD-dependent oxidoreductase [Erythrobacter sp. NAP1]EAQ30643.1 hypothetical protein NAP1_07685 [Erythrobacter sp. NAP1]